MTDYEKEKMLMETFLMMLYNTCNNMFNCDRCVIHYNGDCQLDTLESYIEGTFYERVEKKC